MLPTPSSSNETTTLRGPSGNSATVSGLTSDVDCRGQAATTALWMHTGHPLATHHAPEFDISLPVSAAADVAVASPAYAVHGTASVSDAGTARSYGGSRSFSVEAGPDRASSAPVAPAKPWRLADGVVPSAASKPVYRILKRSLDILGAMVGLAVFGPVMVLCAVLIRLHDGGAIFFRQDRVGEGGRVFKILKFRSMVMDADRLKQGLLDLNSHCDARTFKLADDPRVTPVGRWMRRLSLDEFPQFWNVLMGDMSLVGPRPALPSEVDLYESRDFVRLSVKPGLTCYWQVSGRSKLDFRQQVQLDAKYVEQRGLWTDIKLLARTIPAVLSGDGAV